MKRGYQATASPPPCEWRCWVGIPTQMSSQSFLPRRVTHCVGSDELMENQSAFDQKKSLNSASCGTNPAVSLSISA